MNNGFILSNALGHPFTSGMINIGTANHNHQTTQILRETSKSLHNLNANNYNPNFTNINIRNGISTNKKMNSSNNNNSNQRSNDNRKKSNNNSNSSGNNGGTPTKCTWCDQPRARNDLCNRCRQKVESRARRLVEQKISGDCFVIQKIIAFIQQHLNLKTISFDTFFKTLKDIFPLLVEQPFFLGVLIQFDT